MRKKNQKKKEEKKTRVGSFCDLISEKGRATFIKVDTHSKWKGKWHKSSIFVRILCSLIDH